MLHQLVGAEFNVTDGIWVARSGVRAEDERDYARAVGLQIIQAGEGVKRGKQKRDVQRIGAPNFKAGADTVASPLEIEIVCPGKRFTAEFVSRRGKIECRRSAGSGCATDGDVSKGRQSHAIRCKEVMVFSKAEFIGHGRADNARPRGSPPFIGILQSRAKRWSQAWILRAVEVQIEACKNSVLTARLPV